MSQIHIIIKCSHLIAFVFTRSEQGCWINGSLFLLLRQFKRDQMSRHTTKWVCSGAEGKSDCTVSHHL